MNQASREWLAGMREHVGTARLTPPPAAARSRASVTVAAAAAERMILAAHLATWLQGDLHELLAARRAASTGGDPLPALVVTTSLVGIGVVEAACAGVDRILPFAPDMVMAVTEREYRDWTRLRPDPGHALHVNHWSWVKTHVPARRQAEFAAHPLGPGESYWLHRTGTVGCGRERRSCHLWKWNGATVSLLQPFVPEGVGRL